VYQVVRGSIDKIYDEVAPTGPGAFARLRVNRWGSSALSCRGIIRLLMAAWKIGPVLASGNSFVLKPSEKSPLTAIRVAQLCC